MKTIKKNAIFLFSFQFVLLFLSGVVGVFVASYWEDNNERMLLQMRVATMACLFDGDQISQLSASDADYKNPVFIKYRILLQKIRKDNTDSRFVYLMGKDKRGKLVFLIDAEHENSKDYSPPGQVYDEATEGNFRIFRDGKSFVEGHQDRWGKWISGYAPILGSDGRVVAIIGMDIDTNRWNWQVLFVQILPIFFTFVLFFIMTNIFVYFFQSKKYLSKIEKIDSEKNLVEDKFRLIVDSTDDFCYLYDSNNQFTEINRSFCEAMELDREQIIGKNWRQLGFMQEQIDEWTHLHSRVFVEKKTIESQSKLKMPDGNFHSYEVSLSPITNKGEVIGIAGISHDVTEKERIYEQLKQSQKMEAIGQLAAGVAHDFNNILTGIIGYAELIGFDYPVGSSGNKKVQAIINAGKRAADIVRKLLLFAREDSEKRVIMNPITVIKDVITLIKTTVKDQIYISESYLIEEIYINSSPTIIHQILSNLCVNGIHAIQDTGRTEQGKIDVFVDKIEINEDNFSLFNLNFGKYLSLEVRDNGIGMDNTLKERIFEPFFTTKDQGRGTGLGLAVIYGLVASSGGKIIVDSQLGIGTTFKVLIPEEKKQGLSTGEIEENVKGIEKILLVDDEKSITDIFDIILSDYGYSVVVFNYPREALKIIAEGERFDIVVTDITMPVISGIELTKEIKKIVDMPIIMCSGHGEHEVSEKTRKEYGIIKILAKPIQAKELAREIRKYFDKK